MAKSHISNRASGVSTLQAMKYELLLSYNIHTLIHFHTGLR